MRKSSFFVVFLAVLVLVALMGSTTALASGLGPLKGCKATVTGSSTIKISWNKLNGTYLYSVHCNTDKAYIQYTVAAILDNDVFSYTVTHLDPAQKYYFMVEATPYSDDDPNSYSSVFSATPQAGIAAPTGVKAASASSSKINISWNAVAGATGYAIYSTNANSTAYGSYSLVKTTPSSVHSYSVTGLAANTQRYYRVRALNAKGEGYFSAVVTAWTRTTTPTNLTAKAMSVSSIKLTWKAVAGATSYNIYRCATATGSYVKVGTASAIASPTFTNIGLKSGKTYYYKVGAMNAGGSSSLTAYVHAKTFVQIPG